MKPIFPLALAALTAVLPAASQAATELVLNGSFEYEMGGWSCAPGNGCTLDNTIAPHSGALGMLMQSGDGITTLSQSFETVIGAVYSLSFWVKSTEPGIADTAAWWSAGDVALGSITNISGDFAQVLAQFVATSETTTLTFNVHTNGTGALALDDISVTEGGFAPSPVPLPAPAALLGMGLMGLAALRRSART